MVHFGTAEWRKGQSQMHCRALRSAKPEKPAIRHANFAQHMARDD